MFLLISENPSGYGWAATWWCWGSLCIYGQSRAWTELEVSTKDINTLINIRNSRDAKLSILTIYRFKEVGHWFVKATSITLDLDWMVAGWGVSWMWHGLKTKLNGGPESSSYLTANIHQVSGQGKGSCTRYLNCLISLIFELCSIKSLLTDCAVHIHELVACTVPGNSFVWDDKPLFFFSL